MTFLYFEAHGFCMDILFYNFHTNLIEISNIGSLWCKSLINTHNNHLYVEKFNVNFCIDLICVRWSHHGKSQHTYYLSKWIIHHDHCVVHTIHFFHPLNYNLWATLFQGLQISMKVRLMSLTQPRNLGMSVLKVTHSSTIGHQILLLIASLM